MAFVLVRRGQPEEKKKDKDVGAVKKAPSSNGRFSRVQPQVEPRKKPKEEEALESPEFGYGRQSGEDIGAGGQTGGAATLHQPPSEHSDRTRMQNNPGGAGEYAEHQAPGVVSGGRIPQSKGGYQHQEKGLNSRTDQTIKESRSERVPETNVQDETMRVAGGGVRESGSPSMFDVFGGGHDSNRQAEKRTHWDVRGGSYDTFQNEAEQSGGKPNENYPNSTQSRWGQGVPQPGLETMQQNAGGALESYLNFGRGILENMGLGGVLQKGQGAYGATNDALQSTRNAALQAAVGPVEGALKLGQGIFAGGRSGKRDLFDELSGTDQESQERGNIAHRIPNAIAGKPEGALERGVRRATAEGTEFALMQFLTGGAGGLLPAMEQHAPRAAKFFGHPGNPVKEFKTGALFGAGGQLAEEMGGGGVSQFLTGAAAAMSPSAAAKALEFGKGATELGKDLFKANKLPEGTPKFLEGVGEKAAADLELSQRDVAGRVAKTGDEAATTFEKMIDDVSEPSMKDTGTFRAADVENELLDANQRSLLNQVSRYEGTQKEAWEVLQKTVNAEYDAAKASYSQKYQNVEQAAQGLAVLPTRTQEAVESILSDLEKSIVKAPEEGGVKATLQGILTGLRDIAGAKGHVPVSALLASKRSINRLLEKADIVAAPVDLLKPVSRAIKEDAKGGLARRPSALRQFEEAEAEFQSAQKKYNNDAMLKMRRSENPESLTPEFTKPSNLERLKQALGPYVSNKDLADRLVIEHIAKASKQSAAEMAKESRKYMGQKGQTALDKILEYGNDLTSQGQKRLARGNLLADLQQAATTGSRPDYALKLMRNSKGYSIVKEALNNSPSGKRMFKALQEMTMRDMMNSIIDDAGRVDFMKAKDIFKDPFLRHLAKESVGEKGLKFLENLERYGHNMATNLKNFSLKDKSTYQKILENYFTGTTKGVLGALIYPTGGMSAVPLIAGEAAQRLARVRLQRVLSRPETQDIIAQMGEKGVSPTRMQELMKRFAQVAGRPEKEEESNKQDKK